MIILSRALQPHVRCYQSNLPRLRRPVVRHRVPVNMSNLMTWRVTSAPPNIQLKVMAMAMVTARVAAQLHDWYLLCRLESAHHGADCFSH